MILICFRDLDSHDYDLIINNHLKVDIGILLAIQVIPETLVQYLFD